MGKILLIEPNINTYALMPTMSLAILKGFINEKTNHEAKIIDLVFHKKNWKKLLVETIKEEKPDLVGLSVLSFNYFDALRIARFIKEHFDITIIFGGVHVILSPQETIENDVVDIVCTGEGEAVLKELLDNNVNCTGIQGVWYKQDGTIIKNKNRRVIEPLDVAGFPDFDDFDLRRYFIINQYHLPIMASRGCPYNCSYCSNHALSQKLRGTYVRFRSVEHVIEEIETRINHLKSQGLKYLYFYDDTFILSQDFVTDFCENYRAKGFHRVLKWNVNVRANLVTDTLMKTMKTAGCYEVRMGVEAGNDYIRNEVYKRNMSKQQIVDAFQMIKDNGLLLRLYFMIGAPYETMEMMEESLTMAQESGADEIFFGLLLPLPGTKIKELCEQEDLLDDTIDSNYQSTMVSPVSKTKFASRQQLQEIMVQVQQWQKQKYIREGCALAGPCFVWDVLRFLLFFKWKYEFEWNQIFRWNVQRYHLNKLQKGDV
jgi:radical SAM superfamily enzyme YgiQ (UPF0313 family)